MKNTSSKATTNTIIAPAIAGRSISADTTFRELCAMVPDASGITTPKGKTLIRSDEAVLIRVEEGGATITVYENGFFVYSEGEDNHTARAVRNCRVMKYPKAEGGFEKVGEEYFADLPFPMVLAQFGMVNMEDQKNKQDGYNFGISLDADEVQMEESLCVPDFADGLDLDGDGDVWEKRLAMMPAALESLTEKQRNIITLRYIRKMSQDQIAKDLGIGRTTVQDHLDASLKKLKKFFEKNTRQ